MEYPQFYAETRASWRQWLVENHATGKGVWLVTNKKSSGLPWLGYDEQVEEALCFGWVDSKPQAMDAQRSALRFNPRNPKSKWSKINKERIERLLAAGLMAPAGLRSVEVAKTNGAWVALDAVEALMMPADLQEALAAQAPASVHFEAFPRSVKKQLLEWVSTAKQPETRTKRIRDIAELAARNVRANQWAKKDH